MSSPLLVIHTFPRQTYMISNYLKKVSDVKNVLLSNLFEETDFYVTCNGRITQDEEDVSEGQVYQCVPRLLAGKGGFGSMLRAIGAQIEKTTSREACRDLSGRRMRDVNNEKKLKDWLSKQADREREKEEKRQERLARRRACPQHNFDDPKYVAQRSKVADDLDDALQTGETCDGRWEISGSGQDSPAATVTSADITRKRRAASDPLMKAKRQRGWLGIDPDVLSSESSDDDNQSSSEDVAPAEESSSGLTPKDDTPGSNNPATDESSPSTSSHSGSVAGSKDSTESINVTCETSSASKKEGQVRDEGEVTAESSTLLSSLPPPVSMNKLEDIDLSEFLSASELEGMGMDRLKFALTQRGLKCGGTVQQRAERLFSVKGLTPDQIDTSLFPKPQNIRSKKK
ncbi:replication stress response regulator SDE2-like [Haliotis rubra]|uniref:replication stress response regulator SDE2-like n=1 Tax=Haliotis rubra TaxID=36100 RepID=UPI001EE5E555|nr:replication stress response regulator SDE2-like [Haliotis rubra]